MAITRENRQLNINPHSSEEKVPVGVLNLGEIAVQHNNVEDAALYVETVADSQSASTVAKFITDKAIEALIASAQTSTQIVSANTEDTEKYLTITSETDEETSVTTYTIGLDGIDNAISAATEELISTLNYDGVPQEGKPIVNVTQTEGLLSAETGNINAEFVNVDSAHTLDEVLEEIIEKIEANKVDSGDGSIIVATGANGTELSVNIDGETIVQNDNNELVADLKLSAITPSETNIREEYALLDHNGTQLGDSVKIYKDSSLYNVYLGHVDDELVSPTDPTVIAGSGDTALCFIYQKADETYELVAINVESFLEESEFKDGLVVNNHVVKVKVDDESEKVEINSGETASVLTVGPDGVKVDHIQDAIDYTIKSLVDTIDADVTGTSSDGHVTVGVVQENVKLKEVIVTTDDVASAKELDEVEDAVGLSSAGTHIKTDGYYTSSAETIADEIKALDQVVHDINEKVNNVNVIETGSSDNWVTLTVTDKLDGTTALTLDDSALAEEIVNIYSAITKEIGDRIDADNELLGDEETSTSADTSIWGVKKELEQLIENGVVNEIGFGEVEEKGTEPLSCNVGAAIVDGQSGKKINLDLSEIIIDCGEY